MINLPPLCISICGAIALLLLLSLSVVLRAVRNAPELENER